MNFQSAIPDVLSSQWYHNSLRAWVTAALTAAIIFVVLFLLHRVIVSRLGVLAARTTNRIDDIIVDALRETRIWVLAAIAMYFATATLTLPRISPFLAPAAKLAVLWQIAVWGGAAVTFWAKHQTANRSTTSDRGSIAMIAAMAVGAKMLLWLLVLFTSLKTVFGIEITALITGLGVGGIAIALAVQNILGDLLAALAIVFDKPFDVGDSIGVDTIKGTVEHIGLKTTRIRSDTGEQVIIGNGDLLKSRLRNFKRMYQRRGQFSLDVTFDTPVEVLARLPGIVEEIVKAQSPVTFDHSHIASFGDSAIRIETVYYVLDPESKVLMDVQQAIYLEILRRFAAENVKFAFPSRTVYHEGATKASS